MNVRRAAVIGWPLSRSRSPEIHARLSRLLKIALRYQRLPVAPQELAAFMDRLRNSGAEEGWVGLNVTIPHKEAVLRHLDVVRPRAQKIGAANVVTIGRRRLSGDNTDTGGFLDPLAERGVELAGIDALLFGAGGAARAVAWALASAGASRIHILNRNAARAIELAGALAKNFSKTRFSAGPRWPRRAFLWVNATPLGMEGLESGSPFPLGSASARPEIAYDLVYFPARTRFLRQAEAAGAATIGGAEMLIYQAIRTWELWFEPLGGRRRRQLKERLAMELRWN